MAIVFLFCIIILLLLNSDKVIRCFFNVYKKVILIKMVRINKLAKDLGVKNSFLIAKCQELGFVYIKHHANALTDVDADFVRSKIKKQNMWIVLLDNSGSMGCVFENDYQPGGRTDVLRAKTKLEAAKEALLKHLSSMGTEEQIVLCTFNEDYICLGNDFAASERTRIRNALDGVAPFDGTDLAGAFEFCKQFISTSGTKILVISDGLTDPTESLDQANKLGESGGTIFFILIDPAVQTEELARKIVGSSGGFFWAVRSQNQLDEYLENVYNKNKQILRSRFAVIKKARTNAFSSQEDAIAFTAGFPAKLQPKEWCLLICVVHLKKLADSVQLLLQSQFSPEKDQADVGLASADPTKLFPLGTSVRIVPTIPGISFFPGSYSINWGGVLDPVHFRMRPDDTCSRLTTGFVDFHADGIVVARLRIELEIAEKKHSSEWLCADRNELIHVFLSYSHKDSMVIDKFEKLWNAAGVDYFRDTESLHSGDDWRQKIAGAIYDSSIFQLFWSTNASNSPWVEREYKAALVIKDSKGERFIRPVAWEETAPPLPKELEHLQSAFVNLDQV